MRHNQRKFVGINVERNRNLDLAGRSGVVNKYIRGLIFLMITKSGMHNLRKQLQLIGRISFNMKSLRKPDEANLHVRFEAAGDGNGANLATAPLLDPTLPALSKTCRINYCHWLVKYC